MSKLHHQPPARAFCRAMDSEQGRITKFSLPYRRLQKQLHPTMETSTYCFSSLKRTVGQYCAHFLMPFSTKEVIITMATHPCSQTMRQKLSMVVCRGAMAAMYSCGCKKSTSNSNIRHERVGTDQPQRVLVDVVA